VKKRIAPKVLAAEDVPKPDPALIK
jgi:hypothetical protein